MIGNAHPERTQHCAKRLGGASICRAGLGIPAGVVVRQNQGRGIRLEHIAQNIAQGQLHLPRVTFCRNPKGKHLFRRVEIGNRHDFTRLALKPDLNFWKPAVGVSARGKWRPVHRTAMPQRTPACQFYPLRFG